MQFTTAQVPGHEHIVIIRLNGDLDAESAEDFDHKAALVVEGGASDVLLDLSELVFMSSAGIQAMNTLYYNLHPVGSQEEKKAISKGIRAGTYEAPHLKLLNPNERVQHVLRMAGLDMYIGAYQDEDIAVLAFG